MDLARSLSVFQSSLRDMDSSYQFLMTIGGILLLGLVVSNLASRTFLPRVTLLLIFGAVIGKQGFDLIPHVFEDRFEIIADMTLLMVGFLLGANSLASRLRATNAKSSGSRSALPSLPLYSSA